VNAWFMELAVPILDNLELSAAIRNESFSSGQSSTDPKLGLHYAATDWLSLRGTWGESFIAPTLIQLGQPQNCGLTAVDDPFSTFNAFVATCIEGNPALVPESAETTSFGFDLTPIDGLSINYTWNETDFQDRIVQQSTEDVLRKDFAAFQASTGFAGPGDPSINQLTAWVNGGMADPRIIRSAGDLTKINTIIRSDSNASSIKVSASDLRIAYTTDINDWGTFRVALDASYYHSYEYQLDSEAPKSEAVGRQNGTVGDIPALPEYKANLTLGWNKGQHAASIITRHVDEVVFDANPFSFLQFVPGNNWRDVDTIRAWTDVDAFYTYRDIDLLGGTGALTVGARNLFDRQAQKTGMFAGVVGELQDPLGRMVYARVSFEL
jgi:iron complex outermembrane receptor protein